jgi:hypothetical protein
LQVRPSTGFGHEKRIGVVVAIIRPLGGICLAAPLRELFGDDPLTLDVEHVGRSLEEECAKDVLLELRSVHLSAKNIRRRKQMPFKLGKRQHMADTLRQRATSLGVWLAEQSLPTSWLGSDERNPALFHFDP